MPNDDGMEGMFRAEKIEKILKDLRNRTPGIEGTALVDIEGLPVGSELSADTQEEEVAARVAAILGIGETAAEKLKRGALNKILIEGESGSILIMGIEEKELVLIAITSDDARIGLVFYEAKEAVKTIREIL